MGSLYCGLVLARTLDRVRTRLAAQASPDCPTAFFDMWYMDDGQVFIDPSAADLFLAVLDEELAAVGATRGSGAEVKSVAKLVGSEAACLEVGEDWITERIRATCKLPVPNAPSKDVLGVDVGDGDAQFRAACPKVASARTAIASVGDAATELVLTRMCADACKVTYLLRAHSTDISADAMEAFDNGLDVALATALAGPLGAESLCQAKLGVRDGGLGARSARHSLAPAALASRVSARPLVMHLLAQMRDMDMAPDGAEQAFDVPAQAAEAHMRHELSPAGCARLDILLGDARTHADAELQALLSGRQSPSARPRHPREEPGHALVQLAGGRTQSGAARRRGSSRS